MSLWHLARAALSMSPGVAARKAARFAVRLAKNRLVGILMRRQCTYPDPAQVGGTLNPHLAPLDPAVVRSQAGMLADLVRNTLEHRFNLLGSGWVRVAHGRRYAGFGPWCYGPGQPLPGNWRAALATGNWPVNAAKASSLLGMIDDGYVPIDWQVDFKSGYRWPVRVWGGSTPYGHKPGVDVKVPWELARMQHLPWLALAHAAGPDPRLAREFRNQVLDFLATNPPGWGVNWACAMDVAIRAANIILAWDLFRAHGVTFERAFEEELAAAMLAHGRHIAGHLEWNEAHRGNHYLADVAGLAFIAIYLPCSRETDLWLAFSVQQLEAEILRQFAPDGSNFEASTAYHRLSAEMAAFTVALVLGLPEGKRQALGSYDAAMWKRFPAVAPGPMAWPYFRPEVFERLAGAARFAADATKPSGDAVQIGDNDSGRFFKLCPSSDGRGGERVLDLSHLGHAIDGLFAEGPAHTIDGAVTALLAGRGRPARPAARRPWSLPGTAAEAVAARAVRVVVAVDADALADVSPAAYPDFGLFLWKGPRAFVSVRCGPIGGNGLGGHAHNDQLAVEIEVDGIALVRDPGTFVYTPDLAARDVYRSALAHFVPRQGNGEPARFEGPFRLEDRAQARALRFSGGEFLGRHDGFGEPVWRRVVIGDGMVVIEDCYGGSAITAATSLDTHHVGSAGELARLWTLELPFSPGYGVRQNA